MRIFTALSIACGLALFGCERQAGELESATATESAAAPAMSRRPPPAGASVYIISPADGDELASPVRVAFGLRGAGVAPAGVDSPNTGHHHLLIDAEMVSFDLPIPSDAQHVHFGLGQTETMVELPPGDHRLQLLLGDHLHVPHDPPLLSEPITIRVVE